MQFRKNFKEQIRAGRITSTIRCWQRPQARVGGRYNLHPQGAIEVTSIHTSTFDALTPANAHAAGFADLAALQDYLGCDASASIYQVQFRYLGDSPVNQPSTTAAPAAGVDELLNKLAAMDRRSESPWTSKLLQLISAQPATRAANLAPEFGWPVPRLKSQVRKLKAQGLTISLETGYKLSPLGRQVVEAMGRN